MKKIFLLLSMVSLFSLISCNDDDGEVIVQENYFEAEVFEISNANFGLNSDTGLYTSIYDLDPVLYPADMVLVYRLQTVDQGNDVWELIPRTIYFDNGDFVDFDYNFTTHDIWLTMGANFDLGSDPGFTQTQVFRVVIIPGWDNSGTASRMDFSNYESVIKQFNIDESNIKQLKKK